MVRLIITTVLGLLILFGAITVAKKMIDSAEEPKTVEKKVVNIATALTVENATLPITLSTSGSLVAKNQMDIYAEVTGIFETSAHSFKPGAYYKKGETLLQINGDEHRTTISSQKSVLLNQIVLFLADLKLDYPASFGQWNEYVNSFDIEQQLKALPEPIDGKEKLFVTSKGIYTTYYNIKSLEERAAKYRINAPFSGVIAESMATPGTLVRNGQKVGKLISSSSFEMETKLNVSYLDLLKIGKTVNLHNSDRTKSWQGKVLRIDGRVDPASQTVRVFISVYGSGLKEGMFLEADLDIKSIGNAYEMDRKLLMDGDRVFVIRDTILDMVTVRPAMLKESTVIVNGLEDGTQLLAKPIPGAYRGMTVQISER